MRQVDKKHGAGLSIPDSENELTRARMGFGGGLQAPAEAQSLTAARPLLAPAVWGAALVGGAVAVFTVARLLRQHHRQRELIRILVPPARTERSLARTAAAALARLAIERLLSSVRDAARANAFTTSVSGELPGTLGSDSRSRLDSSEGQRNSITNGRQETIG